MKKRFILRRSLVAASVLVAGGGAVALAATPAGATEKQLTTAGSATTFQVVHAIFGTSVNDLTPGNTTANQVIAATTQLCKGGVNYSAHKPPPHTATLVYPTGTPNGSTAGKTALHNEEPSTVVTTKPATTPAHTVYNESESGCIDFSRSSSPPKTSTASTHFDYYAFALDGVAPLAGSNAGGNNAHPVTLSLKTMENIYRCKPHFRNWDTVTGPKVATNPTKTALHLSNQGGVTAPIVRFWPQTGSGTRSVYSTMFGFTPDTKTGNFHFGAKTDTCGTATHTLKGEAITQFHTVTYHTTTSHSPTFGHTIVKPKVVNEENFEAGIIYYSSLAGNVTVNGTTLGVPKATAIKDAVYIYSAGKFSQEWGTLTSFSKTAVNQVTNTAIGSFNAATLRLGRMLTETTANHPGVNANSFEVFGPPVAGTFTATTNRGSESVNTSTIQEKYEWFAHIPLGTDGAHTSKATIPGVRYVYNVADGALPSFDAAKMAIGFNNATNTATGTVGGKSALCSGSDAGAITNTGFIPLNTGSSAPAKNGGGYGTTGHAPTFGTTFDKVGANCREFQGKHLPDWGTPQSWTPSVYTPLT